MPWLSRSPICQEREVSSLQHPSPGGYRQLGVCQVHAHEPRGRLCVHRVHRAKGRAHHRRIKRVAHTSCTVHASKRTSSHLGGECGSAEDARRAGNSRRGYSARPEEGRLAVRQLPRGAVRRSRTMSSLQNHQAPGIAPGRVYHLHVCARGHGDTPRRHCARHVLQSVRRELDGRQRHVPLLQAWRGSHPGRVANVIKMGRGFVHTKSDNGQRVELGGGRRRHGHGGEGGQGRGHTQRHA